MARLFRDCPEAVKESATLLSRIRFSLEELQYEYPHEPVPEGWTPQGWLEHLVMEEAHKRNPNGLPAKLIKILDEEFRSEEHTSELQSLMRNSYAVLCLK